MTETCRTCRWLGVTLDKAGRRIPRPDKAYQCTVEIKTPILPASITKSPSFRWPPARNYVWVEDGAGCPMHDPIKRRELTANERIKTCDR